MLFAVHQIKSNLLTVNRYVYKVLCYLYLWRLANRPVLNMADLSSILTDWPFKMPSVMFSTGLTVFVSMDSEGKHD